VFRFGLNILYFTDDSTNYQTLIGSSAGNKKGFTIERRSGKYFLYLESSSGTDISKTFNTNIDKNQWNHLVLTGDGTTIKLYVNNNLDSSTLSFSGFGGTSNDEYNVHIGRPGMVDNYYVEGLIDEVGIWDRALNSSEIEELYNSGDGLQYPFSFDEFIDEFILSTLSADNILYNGSRLRGSIIDMGEESEVDTYFQYKKNSSESWTDTTPVTQNETGTYTETISSLDEDTLYDFKFCVEFSNETVVCDDIEQFTTLEYEEPILILTTPSDYTNTTIRLNADVDDLGSSSAIDVYFEYKLSSASTYTTLSSVEITGNVSTFDDLTSLEPLTEYTYRACAIHNEDTLCTDTDTFITSSLHEDLKFYYKLDEGTGTTLSDSHILGNNGTLSSSLWSTNGLINNAVNLINQNHYITAGYYSNLQRDVSVQAWVNIYDNTSTNSIFKFQYNSCGNNGLRIQYINGNFYIVSSITGVDPSYLIPYSLNENEWYHVVATAEQQTTDTTTLKLYVNNENIFNQTITFEDYYSITAFYYGLHDDVCIAGRVYEYYDGLFDEVAYWEKILNEDDIELLYNNGNGNVYDFTNYEPEEAGVVTDSLSDLTSSSVTLYGSYGSGSYEEVDVFFQYRKGTSGTWSETTPQTKTDFGGFEANLTGLDSDSLYEYRAALTYDTTTIYGETWNFTTDETPISDTPEIETYGAPVGIYEATLRGRLTLNDYSEVLGYFQYKLDSSSNWIATNKVTLSSNGIYYRNIDNLLPNTLYNFRAVIEYSGYDYIGSESGIDGTEYGEIQNFTTQPETTDLYRIKSLTDYEAEFNETIIIDIDDYFINFDNIVIVYTYNETQETLLVGETNYHDDFEIFLINDTILIYTLESNHTQSFEVYVYQQFNYLMSEFEVDINEDYTGVSTEDEPLLITNPITQITDTTARLNGYLVDLGECSSFDLFFTYIPRDASSTEEILIQVGFNEPFVSTYTYPITELSPSTTYDVLFYGICLDDDVTYQSSSKSFTTSSSGLVSVPDTSISDDSDFGELFNVLLGGSFYMRMLIGVIIIMAIMFFASSQFGKNGVELGTFGLMIFFIISVILVTVLGLFPVFILILFIVLGILAVMLKTLFTNGQE